MVSEKEGKLKETEKDKDEVTRRAVETMRKSLRDRN